jgi:hypothetical protein
MGLVRHLHIVGVLAGAGEEAIVLFALDASADQQCTGGLSVAPPIGARRRRWP